VYMVHAARLGPRRSALWLMAYKVSKKSLRSQQSEVKAHMGRRRRMPCTILSTRQISFENRV